MGSCQHTNCYSAPEEKLVTLNLILCSAVCLCVCVCLMFLCLCTLSTCVQSICVSVFVYTVRHRSVTLWSSVLKIYLYVVSGPFFFFSHGCATEFFFSCPQMKTLYVQEGRKTNSLLGDLEVLKLQCF